MAKLTEKQWSEIQRRLNKGEKAADLAREFKVTRGAISQKCSKQQKTVRAVANQIVNVEKTIQNLPLAIQIEVFSLANELMAISTHVSQGARYGAMTFHRLTGVANQHAQKIDDVKPDEDALITVAKLTKTANDAVAPALNLLAANKAQMEKMSASTDNLLDELLEQV